MRRPSRPGRRPASLLDASKDLTRQAEIMRTEVERYISGVSARTLSCPREQRPTHWRYYNLVASPTI